MTYNEAKKICETFALKHRVIFDEEGSCGFGRDCVGFRDGGAWVDHNPHNPEDYELMEEYICEAAYPPEGTEAYHKHDCLAVLGHGESSVIALAKWVQSMEKAGEVKIVTYDRGHKDLISQCFHGLTGRTVIIVPVA